MSAHIKNGKVVKIETTNAVKTISVIKVKNKEGLDLVLKKKDVQALVDELESKTLVADHVVVTRFRNDDSQPTLFANTKGEFVSVANKEEFQKLDKEGSLKLTVDEAKTIVSVEGFDKTNIEISPGFTVDQFIAQL